jgi:hypothetical protein
VPFGISSIASMMFMREHGGDGRVPVAFEPSRGRPALVRPSRRV